jgi:hypothetical protein
VYLIQIDHRVFEKKGGGGFTLVEALDELYGTFNCRVLRLDGTPAVEKAGSSISLIHAPTGRRVVRRLTAVGRRKYEEQMKWSNAA